MARLRKFFAAPITWWTRSTTLKPSLEQSAWERGQADAVSAAQDGRLFGLVATVVTCAVPTAVGFATTQLPTGIQIALIVVSAAAAYVCIPFAWAICKAIAAPARQRDEARREITTRAGQIAAEEAEAQKAANDEEQKAK